MRGMRRRGCGLAALCLLASVLPAAAQPASGWGPLELAGRMIAPGEAASMSFLLGESFVGSMLDTLVVAVRGAQPGSTLCVIGGVHGDEINGVEIARRLYASLDPAEVAGTVIIVPALNAYGFRTGNRYLPDRRDLNRYFPGSPNGNTAEIIAHAVFAQVRQHCNALIDLHTGSFDRTNLPQIRVDTSNRAALEIARHFGVGVVLDGSGPDGSLRRAAMDAGIPAVIYEAGEPLRFQEDEIARGVAGVRNVLGFLEILPRQPSIAASTVYRSTRWVRATRQGGVFLTPRRPGEQLQAGDVLGTVTDPITNAQEVVVSPVAGRLIGMAQPQVVLVGYALFHIGLEPR